jgi:alpha-glucosidase (family GH31 glycosyl hydrolase)
MAFSSPQFAFSDVNVVILGRTLVGFQGVKYKITSEKEPVFGRGKKALAIQDGNERIEGELMLLQTELELLVQTVKAANPAQKLTDVSFDIVVTYGNGNTAKTDVIRSAKITEYEKGMEQEDKFMQITLPFLALDVNENV